MTTGGLQRAGTAVPARIEEFHKAEPNVRLRYPIASFTWLYVPEHAADPARGKAVNEFVQWALDKGQEIARERGYVPLPASVLARVREKAATIP